MKTITLSTGTAVELTEKEQALILDILTDDYNGRRDEKGTPWSWSVADGSRARAAILGSLVTKGVCFSREMKNAGNGSRAANMICGFTPEAQPAISEHFVPLV